MIVLVILTVLAMMYVPVRPSVAVRLIALVSFIAQVYVPVILMGVVVVIQFVALILYVGYVIVRKTKSAHVLVIALVS